MAVLISCDLMLEDTARAALVLTRRLVLVRRMTSAPQADHTLAAIVSDNAKSPCSGPSKARVRTGPRPPAKKYSALNCALAPAGRRLTPR